MRPRRGITLAAFDSLCAFAVAHGNVII